MFPQNLLNHREIESLAPADKDYKKSFGKALYLLIKPNGKKYWRLKYRKDGKEKSLALGVFPQVSLQEAIKARDEARLMLDRGIDPNQVRQEEKLVKKEMLRTPVFKMNLSKDGSLSIQTSSSTLKLTKQQTDALKLFLEST